MDYFKILNFSREPFSNSPDPEIFFESDQHVGCLHKLELAVRMHRGLNTVIGEVGTGKTTLCRQLIRRFREDEDVLAYLVLDPYFSSEKEFLRYVAALFQLHVEDNDASEWQLKEWLKQYLFRKGVDEGKTVLLIIDEGQKISPSCLEILREFLNYETNSAKLLQIVIFAQKEFERILEQQANLADRINMNYYLEPLNFRDTAEMIRYRLNEASTDGRGSKLFSRPAIWMIYRKSGGYPRRIINICHKIILAMIIKNRGKAGFRLALSAAGRVLPDRSRSVRPAFVYLPLAITAAVLLFTFGSDLLPDRVSSLSTGASQASSPEHSPEKTAGPQAGEKDDKYGGESRRKETAPISGGETEKAAAPAILGTIRVGSRDTLGGMIRNVYGPYSFNPENVARVLEANPWIEDPDFIPVGKAVSFPDLDLPAVPEERWWVQVATAANLQAAYEEYVRLDENLPDLLLLPPTGKANPDFTIALEKAFTARKQAAEAAAQLPPEIRTGVALIQQP